MEHVGEYDDQRKNDMGEKRLTTKKVREKKEARKGAKKYKK
jgi:hypothetical protein